MPLTKVDKRAGYVILSEILSNKKASKLIKKINSCLISDFRAESETRTKDEAGILAPDIDISYEISEEIRLRVIKRGNTENDKYFITISFEPPILDTDANKAEKVIHTLEKLVSIDYNGTYENL